LGELTALPRLPSWFKGDVLLRGRERGKRGGRESEREREEGKGSGRPTLTQIPGSAHEELLSR